MWRFVVFVTVIALCNALDLPTYMQACSRSDPNLNACFEERANAALSTLAKGDPAFNIPSLIPLHFKDRIDLNHGLTIPFKFALRNVVVYNLENCKITHSKINLKDQTIEFLIENPRIVWQSGFEAGVKVLLQDLKTEGSHNATFVGKYLYKMKYELKTIDGKEYAHVKSHSMDFIDVDVAHQLDNLGNNVLTNHWNQAKEKFIGESIINPCSEFVTMVFNSIFALVPFDKIFLP